MPHRRPIKKQLKSEQLMFRASKSLARAIRKAAADQGRSVADWLRQTIENALGSTSSRVPKSLTWEDQIDKLAAAGHLIKGTQEKPSWLLEPPPGPGPAGVLDALLDERRTGR